MTIELTGSQQEIIDQLKNMLEKVKSMTTLEFMSLNEITKPLETPLK